MDKKFLVALAILSFAEIISTTDVICYHGTWSHYRTGNGQFSVSAVPANLCDIYIYAFVGLDSATNAVVTLDSWLDISLGQLNAAADLKNVNPNLKVLLAVGGWNEGSARYSVMAADATSRATFIASALSWVQTYNFDGFDLDWEYPGRRDSVNADDKANFALLVKEFYEAFNPLGLIVTAAVSALPSTVDISYDVPALSTYLTYINVMLYDFHMGTDSTAGHNAPLYSAARYDSTIYADYNINASIHGWLDRTADPSRLALGVPFYGRTTILSSASDTAPGASTTSTGMAPGPYTATSGFLGYNEIVELFNAGGWTTAWDDEQQVPYAYNGTNWISYENEESLAIKCAYAKSLGLGAIMIWSIETEDFLGLSGTQYPLLTAINNALATSESSTSTAATSSSSSTESSSTENSSTENSSTENSSTESSSTASSSTAAASSDSSSIADANSCSSVGYYRCSSDCSVYYFCQLVHGNLVGTQLTCGSELYYDTTTGICNYKDAVAC